MLPNGHALIHILHAIHFFGSGKTAPFSSLEIASIGHIFMHAASSHCMHMTGTAISASSKKITLTPEFEQTDSQVPQLMHFSGEIVKILLMFVLDIALAIPAAPPFILGKTKKMGKGRLFYCWDQKGFFLILNYKITHKKNLTKFFKK